MSDLADYLHSHSFEAKKMSEQPITAERIAEIRSKLVRWRDGLNYPIQDDLEEVLDAMTSAQARVTELEAQLGSKISLHNAAATGWEKAVAHNRAIARAALELLIHRALHWEQLGERYKGITLSAALREVTIDAILARAKETGNVG